MQKKIACKKNFLLSKLSDLIAFATEINKRSSIGTSQDIDTKLTTHRFIYLLVQVALGINFVEVLPIMSEQIIKNRRYHGAHKVVMALTYIPDKMTI